MNNISFLASSSPRVEDVEKLLLVLPECIQRAADEVGADGVKAFFNGYKDSVELRKIAA